MNTRVMSSLGVGRHGGGQGPLVPRMSSAVLVRCMAFRVYYMRPSPTLRFISNTPQTNLLILNPLSSINSVARRATPPKHQYLLTCGDAIPGTIYDIAFPCEV